MTKQQEKTTLRGRVVIFDDEVPMGRILVKTLGLQGFEAQAFSNPLEGLQALSRVQPDVLLTDIRMPELDGMSVLTRMRKEWPDVPVLIFTAFGTVEGAVKAMQEGAFNYITKPFDQANLVAQLERAIEHRHMRQENERLSEQLSVMNVQRPIIGSSSALTAVKDMIGRAAPTDASVLITGASGVGKELVARAIHAQSHRRHRRFVAINCPSIPANLIESEMFGYEKGAFTGADRSKMGLVELAQGGTLFLDELAELPMDIQAKLLRVIQEREIQRVGGLKQIPVDLRLIAATNRNLSDEMEKGNFREDLFYRLNVVNIEIPGLAQRRDDIPMLARHFVRELARRLQRPALDISPAALEALADYPWPGNVRELENVLERTAILVGHDVIEPGDIALGPPSRNSQTPAPAHAPAHAATPGMAIDYRQARVHFEREYLQNLIEHAENNMSRAAQMSGISRRNLYDKLEKAGLAGELTKKRDEH